jgi:hypothetical protein
MVVIGWFHPLISILGFATLKYGNKDGIVQFIFALCSTTNSVSASDNQYCAFHSFLPPLSCSGPAAAAALIYLMRENGQSLTGLDSCVLDFHWVI